MHEIEGNEKSVSAFPAKPEGGGPMQVLSVVKLPTDRLLVVLHLSDAAAATSGLLEMRLACLISRMQSACERSSGCACISAPVSFQRFAQSIRELQECLDNTLDRSGRILHPSDSRPIGAALPPEALRLWETLLQAGEGENLISRMTEALDLRSKSMTHADICAIRQDVTQMVYNFLKQHELQAHRLFGDKESETAYHQADKSIEAMKHYERLLVTKALACCRSETSGDIIETVKQYIDAHLAEDLQRMELAALVYVSPDYLSRLFKKETGQLLNQYIVKRRMNAACTLLRKEYWRTPHYI